MATDTSAASPAGTDEAGESELSLEFTAAIAAVLRSYRYMEMPVRRYVGVILLPSVLLSMGIIVGAFALPVPLALAAPLALLGLFLPVLALVYPKLLEERKRKEVREVFHLFITHITILSTTNIDRVEVFRTLANEDEYQEIAAEMGRIVALIDTWNQSLEDACRMRAKLTPSPLMEDFLERMAYTVGAGQSVAQFLLSEQDSIVQNFTTRYESQLDRMGLIKDVYMSVMLSTTFGLVFAMLLPFLLGIDPLFPLLGVVGLYLILQLFFLYGMNGIAPSDPVWYQESDVSLSRNVRIRLGLLVGVALCLVATAAVWASLTGRLPGKGTIPEPIYLAIPFTPLLIPGLILRQEQRRVKSRDESFPAFIRALGAVESVKQSSTSSVLEGLREKDFGPLTQNITTLYRRLAIRIDSTMAWRYFAAETGSYLIQKFSDMYVVGRRMGGEPSQLGDLIDRNLSIVLQLRRKRSQQTGTIVGVIYGLNGASAFAFFVGLKIINILKELSADMDLSQAQLSGLLSAEVYDIPQIRFLLFVVIVVNALLSSIMIRIVDRGHPISTFPHFVAQVWIMSVVSVITAVVVGGVVQV